MREARYLLACHGGSPLSRATGEVAAELERSRAVLRVLDAESLPDASLVVLDGCSAACTARRLAAAGRHPEALIELTELGVTAESLDSLDCARVAAEVVRRLDRGERASVAGRPLRPGYGIRARASAAHTVDDYLLALDTLAAPVAECGSLLADAPTLASHVAGMLGLTRPSAGQMLARLEQDDLICRGPRKELSLTGKGRAAADRALRRRRLLEVFAVSSLGFSVAESWTRAATLAPAFDDDAIGRLERALGDPFRCPHGWPLDPKDARAESEELEALGTLRPGETATIVRLAESTSALDRIVELGLLPGTAIECVRNSTFAAGTRRLEVAPDEAAGVLVRRSDPAHT